MPVILQAVAVREVVVEQNLPQLRALEVVLLVVDEPPRFDTLLVGHKSGLPDGPDTAGAPRTLDHFPLRIASPDTFAPGNNDLPDASYHLLISEYR